MIRPTRISHCSTFLSGKQHTEQVIIAITFFSWGLFGGIPKKVPWDPSYFKCMRMIAMPLWNGSLLLLQFADDTCNCLICSGDDQAQVNYKDLPCCDLSSLARWTATNKMQVNVGKSGLKWSSVKTSKSSPPLW